MLFDINEMLKTENLGVSELKYADNDVRVWVDCIYNTRSVRIEKFINNEWTTHAIYPPQAI